jgi:hypothetical protein
MIDRIQESKSLEKEKPAVSPQVEIQKEVLRQTMEGENTAQQLMQVLANVQPAQQIQATGRAQVTKSGFDVKV